MVISHGIPEQCSPVKQMSRQEYGRSSLMNAACFAPVTATRAIAPAPI